MVRQTDERKNVFKRINVRNMVTSAGMTNAEIVEFCMDKIERIHSLLIICNTKKQAKSLYQSLQYYTSEEQLFVLWLELIILYRLLDVVTEALNMEKHAMPI